MVTVRDPMGDGCLSGPFFWWIFPLASWVARRLPLVGCEARVGVGRGPEGGLQLRGFSPGEAHGGDFLGGVVVGGEVGLDGLVDDGEEGKDVAQGDVGRGLDLVGLVFAEAGVAKGDLV